MDRTDRRDKCKVLFVSLHTEIGGGEVVLYQIVKNLDKSKYEPVVMFNKRGTLVEKLEKIGIRTVIIPFSVVMLQQCVHPKIFWRNFRSSWEIKKYISAEGIDIVQCSDVLALLLLLPAMLFLRVPVVISVIFFYERTRVFLLDIISLLGVKCAVTPSFAVKDDIQRKTFLLKKKMKVIHCGVDSSDFTPKSAGEIKRIREKLGLPPDKKIVGFIGRYETWKGHITYITAAKIILKTRSDISFLMAGGAITGTIIPAVALYEKNVMKFIETSDLTGSLIMWDHREDVPEIMASLDLFVCPSDYEPFGLVVLEALASGIPVVLSDSVGAMEVVGGFPNVYMAEPKNPQSFANQIVKALEDESRNRYIPIIKQELSRMTWPAYTRQYEEIYRVTRILSKKRINAVDLEKI